MRLRSSYDYRYVGQTSTTVALRLRQHFKVAASGRKTPFYDWLRKQERAEVIAEVVAWISGRAELGQAEIDWIAYLRTEGQPLLNVSDGGLGPTGVEWTEEMREAARIRSTGRKGVSRYGAANPFFGHSHSADQRAKWSNGNRPGFRAGLENPNFGRFGADHPSFGRAMPEEARARLSEQRRGKGNPNYGRKASAKMSAARRGKPRPSSRRSAHTRHHTNKGIFKETCQHCLDDLNAGVEGDRRSREA
ncbi:NUMOD3 domain-containing DNA-binding protein [Gordonia iterans]